MNLRRIIQQAKLQWKKRDKFDKTNYVGRTIAQRIRPAYKTDTKDKKHLRKGVSCAREVKDAARNLEEAGYNIKKAFFFPGFEVEEFALHFDYIPCGVIQVKESKILDNMPQALQEKYSLVKNIGFNYDLNTVIVDETTIVGKTPRNDMHISIVPSKKAEKPNENYINLTDRI